MHFFKHVFCCWEFKKPSFIHTNYIVSEKMFVFYSRKTFLTNPFEVEQLIIPKTPRHISQNIHPEFESIISLKESHPFFSKFEQTLPSLHPRKKGGSVQMIFRIIFGGKNCQVLTPICLLSSYETWVAWVGLHLWRVPWEGGEGWTLHVHTARYPIDFIGSAKNLPIPVDPIKRW